MKQNISPKRATAPRLRALTRPLAIPAGEDKRREERRAAMRHLAEEIYAGLLHGLARASAERPDMMREF